jgi:membrane-bound serine protease (ClpP class)
VLLVLALLSLLFLPAPWSYLVVVGAIVVEAAELWLWRRFLGHYRVTTGAEGLVGAPAEVVEPCDPAGRVRVRGELWQARCAKRAVAGQRMRVTRVDGLTLEVEPE